MADQISKHILFCHCGGERIHPGLPGLVTGHLKKLPVEVTGLSDLCGLAAKSSGLLTDLFNRDTEYLVLGCYPRIFRPDCLRK